MSSASSEIGQLSEEQRSLLAFLLAAEGVTLPASIRRCRLDLVSPPSCSQERLWFLDQYEPGSPNYNIPAALRVDGNVIIAAMQQALTEIRRRHHSLRTILLSAEGRAQPVVGNNSVMELPLVDLCGLVADARAALAEELARIEGRRPFSLSAGPLVRGRSLRLVPGSQVMMLNMHHIVSDGWSVGILIRELVSLYSEMSRGEQSASGELEVQFGDYVVWQRGRLTGKAYEEMVGFWAKELSGAPPVLELPTDRPRPALQTYRGAALSFAAPKELSAALYALGSRENVSQYMTLVACLNVLLMRWSGQEDICVGSPIAGRTQPEIEGLIGFFANTIVLRTRMGGDPSFLELLATVKKWTLGVYANQELPFDRLVEALRPERSLSYSPLFQVMFALQNGLVGSLDLPGLKFSPVQTKGGVAKFDLALWAADTPDGLAVTWDYNTDLFDGSTIRRMAAQWMELLNEVVLDPGGRVWSLRLLNEAEEAQLLEEWNDNEAAYQKDLSIYELFDQQAERAPDAVVVAHGDEQVTYGALFQRAGDLADYLRERGVGPDTLVGACMERSVEMVAGLLGILTAGAAYVPMDPAYPRQRLTVTIEDSQVPVLVADGQTAAVLPKTGATVVRLDAEVQHGVFEAIRHHTMGRRSLGDNLAYLIYTSGSTGRPKGVGIANRSTTAFLEWARKVFDEEDRQGILAATSVCFDLSVFELFLPLCWGGKVIIAGNALELPIMDGREALTLINTVPSAMSELVRMGEFPTGLRRVNLAGELLKSELVDEIYAATGVERVYDLYGPTETTTYSTFSVRERGAAPRIGRPIAGTQAHLVGRRDQVCGLGVEGEIHLAGAGLARCYLDRPTLTAERFVPVSTNGKGVREYCVGDLVRSQKDGNLRLAGRKDHQVKVRGFRIELGEIEAVLASHRAVRECVVVAPEVQSGERRLIAYVVSGEGERSTVDELRAHLSDRLPDYMVPPMFVFLDSLPLTENGKVDRKALPHPEGRPELESRYVAPRNSTEEKLAEIWSEVLQLDNIGVNDDFFSLGGHSLLAARLISKVQRRFDKGVPLLRLFSRPTVAGMAEILDSPMGAPAIVSAGGDLVLEEMVRQDLSEDRRAPISSNEIPGCETILQSRGLLLTGATGFVGSFLLAEILSRTTAVIYCLVRGAGGREVPRLLNAMGKYGLGFAAARDRVVAIPGSLDAPNLGLSKHDYDRVVSETDTVVHCGAWVHHQYPYSILRAANVEGTRSLVRLAMEGPQKKFHYVSTASIKPGEPAEEAAIDAQVEYARRLPGGYLQTKWVSERLVRSAERYGLSGVIYRIGRTTGASATGACNSDDAFSRFLETCRLRGNIPDLDAEFEITPVDFLARALVGAMSRPGLAGKTVRLRSSSVVTVDVIRRVAAELGLSMLKVQGEQWLSDLVKDADSETAAPMAAYLGAIMSQKMDTGLGSPPGRGRVDTSAGVGRAASLIDMDVEVSQSVEELIRTYLVWLDDAQSARMDKSGRA